MPGKCTPGVFSQSCTSRSCLLSFHRPHLRPDESQFGGLGSQQVRSLSLLCHHTSISSKKESRLPQNSRSSCLLHKEQVERGRHLLRRLQRLMALSSASHRVDRSQVWANPWGFNSNSQSLDSYKTCILTPLLGLTKAASCQKREVSAVWKGPLRRDYALHNVMGTLSVVDIADLSLYYDSFLVDASKMSWGRGTFLVCTVTPCGPAMAPEIESGVFCVARHLFGRIPQ